jgi:hypothetical protein
MRILLAIVILAGLGWSGWWYFGATMRQNAVEDWLSGRRDAGWVAEAGDIAVHGFPNRIDMIVEGLDLADPEAGWARREPARPTRPARRSAGTPPGPRGRW